MQVGNVDIYPIADGTFRASPQYFGDHVTIHGHEDLFSRHGKAWLPIGCFLVRTGSRNILIDAGVGPEMRDDGPRRLLVGGQLMTGLRAIGVLPADIDDVICTHLHSDHCGWLFDTEARPVFPTAGIWFGAPDWQRFVASLRDKGKARIEVEVGVEFEGLKAVAFRAPLAARGYDSASHS